MVPGPTAGGSRSAPAAADDRPGCQSTGSGAVRSPGSSSQARHCHGHTSQATGDPCHRNDPTSTHEPMAMTPGTLRSPLPRSPVHADATIAQDAGPCHRANPRQTWRRAGGASRATTGFYAKRCIAAVLATLSSLISRCKGLVSSSQPPVPARPRSRTRMLPKRFTHVVTPNYRACSGTGRACRTRHVSPCTCRLPRENCTSTLQRSAAWRPSVQQLLARRS